MLTQLVPLGMVLMAKPVVRVGESKAAITGEVRSDTAEDLLDSKSRIKPITIINKFIRSKQ